MIRTTLSVSLLAFVLTGTARAQTVWWGTSLDKFRQSNDANNNGDAPPPSGDPSVCASSGSCPTISLSAARNEFESFQVFVAAGGSAISNVNVTVSDLSDGLGHSIPANRPSSSFPANVMIYREHYIDIAPIGAWNGLSNDAGKPGWTADALVPKYDEYFGEARKMPDETGAAFPFTVQANKKQGVWIDLYVPQSQTPQTYTGTVQVTSSVGTFTFPLSLLVRGMSALPSQPTLKTSFRVGVSDLINGHNLPFNDTPPENNVIGSMVCLYSKELLLHRVSNWASLWPRPTFSRDGSNVVHISNAVDLSGQPCTTSFLQLLQGNDPNLLPNGKLPNAALAWAQLYEPVNVSDAQYHQDYSDYFSQNGIAGKLYDNPGNVNPQDEPDQYACGTSAWTAVYQHANMAQSKGLNTMLYGSADKAQQCFGPTGMPGTWSQYFNYFNPVVTQIQPDGPGAADTRSTYDPLAAPPKALWWYTGCNASGGCGPAEGRYPAAMADLAPVYSRMQEWLAYKYSIGHSAPGPTTELYWDTTANFSDITDPWHQIGDETFHDDGDGALFYPGKTSVIGGSHDIPVPSIRLKLLREALEDYEYLKQVEQKPGYGASWIDSNILEPYLAGYDGTVCTFNAQSWQGNSDTRNSQCYASSPKGILKARDALANVLAPGSSATLQVFANGSGSVTSNDGTINCPSTSCSHTYSPPGASVTLTAQPQAGASFTGWTGSCSGTATTCALTMDADKSATATFTSTTCAYTDCFNRANSASLGPSWNTYQPTLQIINGTAQNSDAGAKASQYTTSIGTDQEIIVDCLVTAAGSNCGLMGRWTDASNHYYGFLDAGLGAVYLYRVQNGTATSLGSAPRTIAANTYYKLRLLIQGTSISLFFNSESTATVAAVDSALTSGSYGGLHAYAGGVQTVVYKDFNIVAAPPPATLFSDDFNRTSGMGSNWSSVYGSYTTNGSSAVSGTPPIQGDWEKVATAIGSTNVAVVARLMVPQGALDSGVVARSSTGEFDSDLYSAQIATDGNVYLYRRDNYGWTTLASSPATIQANTWYTLKLITTGSGPVHLEAWLDGTQKIVLDDTNTPNLNGSGVGIECYDANVQYDSFSVLQQ